MAEQDKQSSAQPEAIPIKIGKDGKGKVEVTLPILQRIVGNQVTQLGAYNDPINLEDGMPHDLVWQRDANGKMRVYLDKQQLIIATDKQITGNFDGWLNVNQGGAYWIREISVVAM